MRPLAELVDGASSESAAVSTLLRKVKVLASRLGNLALEEWVDHELTGYPPSAELPTYRGPFGAEVVGHFGGPAGSGLSNAPIPPSSFPHELRDGYLFKLEFRQPVAELERLSLATVSLRSDWPADAIALGWSVRRARARGGVCHRYLSC